MHSEDLYREWERRSAYAVQRSLLEQIRALAPDAAHAHSILRVERTANEYVDRYCCVDEFTGTRLDWSRYKDESIADFRARVPRSWKQLSDVLDECAQRGVRFY